MRPQLGKEKILDAAVNLFSEQGYHGASISDIAAAAGVSKGLTYNYFKSKEELLLAIVNQASERMFSVAKTMHAGDDSYQDQLKAFLATYSDFITANKPYLAFQLSLMFQPDLRPVVADALELRAAKLIDETETMMKRGGAADPRKTAMRLVTELDGIGVHYLAVFSDYPLTSMLDQLYDNYKDLTT